MKLFNKSYMKSIGDIEKTNPWRETVYKFGPYLHPWFYVVHWEAPKRSLFSSRLGGDERHTWRLKIRKVPATFIVKYGRQDDPNVSEEKKND